MTWSMFMFWSATQKNRFANDILVDGTRFCLLTYVGKWSRLGRNKLSDVTALPMCIAPGVRNPTVKRGDKLAFRNADVCNLERPVPHATYLFRCRTIF